MKVRLDTDVWAVLVRLDSVVRGRAKPPRARGGLSVLYGAPLVAQDTLFAEGWFQSAQPLESDRSIWTPGPHWAIPYQNQCEPSLPYLLPNTRFRSIRVGYVYTRRENIKMISMSNLTMCVVGYERGGSHDNFGGDAKCGLVEASELDMYSLPYSVNPEPARPQRPYRESTSIMPSRLSPARISP